MESMIFSVPRPARLGHRRARWPASALAALLLAMPPTSLAGSSDADSAADSSDAALPTVGSLPGAGEVLPEVRQPFRAGESLKFSVQYGFIKAGNAWLEIPEMRDWEGRSSYLLVARAESNAFFSRFYKVRNRIESTWDSLGRYSHRYTETRREGGHRASSDIVFDYARQHAVYKDGREFPIPPDVQDALSSFYFTRTRALPLGGSVFFDYHASRKSLPLEVKVLGREQVKTPAGTFDCVVVEPILKAGGIFKNKGRLVIWLTDDERRMPVMMRSKVTIGSINVLLVEAKTGA
jgi:hypothetical protein